MSQPAPSQALGSPPNDARVGSLALDAERTLLLKLENISKVFGGVRALKSVKFDVMPGEVLCLAGENGCGKSTIIKIISGVYTPEPGAVMLMDGESIEGLDPARARELGIQVIWQDLALFPEMTVAENIAFEQNLGPRPRVVNYGKMKDAARRILDRLGVSIDLNRSVPFALHRPASNRCNRPRARSATPALSSWTSRLHR